MSPNSKGQADRDTAIKKLSGIRAEHAAGKDFAELAKTHSECPSGKKAGGSLGWVTRGMMVPEFEEALFATEVGQVSDIVETQFGYHIIYRMETRRCSPGIWSF